AGQHPLFDESEDIADESVETAEDVEGAEEISVETETSVVTSQWVAGKIGYIRLDMFTESAPEQFETHLNEMKKAGLTSLILDLRNNPGGLIHSVEHIAGMFIDKGILMYTKDRGGVESPFAILHGEKLNIPVTVLVNENSASAS